MIKIKVSRQPKDNKPDKTELELYREELIKAVGRKSRIEKALDNDKMFLEYLAQIGVNPEWFEKAACVEIIRARIIKILRNGKSVRIREKEILSAQGDIKVNEDGALELGDSKEILHNDSNNPGDVLYENMTNIKKYELRRINQYGVVVYEMHRFGGNGTSSKVDDYNQLIEYTRIQDSPVVQYHSEYRINGNTKESTTKDYDFAYPVTLEKNGMNREKTPIYFTKRYPKYLQWFDERYKNKEKFISNVFDRQVEIMSNELNLEREKVFKSIDDVTSLRIKMNDLYSAIIETLENSKGGKMYKFLLFKNIESYIQEDPNKIFSSEEQKKVVHEAIITRLSEEPLDIDELKSKISKDKRKVKERLKENKELQKILRLVTLKKSIDDDDYSLSEAFKDVQARSSAISEFQQNNTPFDDEKERLDAKYKLLNLQKDVLQHSVRAIPHYRKKVKNKTLQKELKHTSAEAPSNPGDGGR